jgi:hypothetical protein
VRVNPTLLIVILALETGCGPRIRNAARYSWTCAAGACAPAQLSEDHAACADEARSTSKWLPLIAANGVHTTLYKDCMEKRGYIKVGSSARGIRYQSQNDSLSLSPGVEPPGPGEVDLMLWP